MLCIMHSASVELLNLWKAKHDSQHKYMINLYYSVDSIFVLPQALRRLEFKSPERDLNNKLVAFALNVAQIVYAVG